MFRCPTPRDPPFRPPGPAPIGQERRSETPGVGRLLRHPKHRPPPGGSDRDTSRNPLPPICFSAPSLQNTQDGPIIGSSATSLLRRHRLHAVATTVSRSQPTNEVLDFPAVPLQWALLPCRRRTLSRPPAGPFRIRGPLANNPFPPESTPRAPRWPRTVSRPRPRPGSTPNPPSPPTPRRRRRGPFPRGPRSRSAATAS